MRIDGDTVTVKAGQCPQDRVRRVEVWDSGTERRIWRGDDPLTEAGQRGLLPLWGGEAYRTSSPAARPSELPKTLDVTVDHGPDHGVSEVFAIEVDTGAHNKLASRCAAPAHGGQLPCRVRPLGEP